MAKDKVEEVAPEVVVTPKTAKEAEEKELKVRGLEDHKCSIAKIEYIIEKGKETKLPVGVAMILAGSQKIMILG